MEMGHGTELVYSSVSSWSELYQLSPIPMQLLFAYHLHKPSIDVSLKHLKLSHCKHVMNIFISIYFLFPKD